MLKMKTSRAVLSEVNTKCGSMPFCLRSLGDEKKARMGVVECVAHKLLEPFHVLYEKPCTSYYKSFESSKKKSKFIQFHLSF